MSGLYSLQNIADARLWGKSYIQSTLQIFVYVCVITRELLKKTNCFLNPIV